MNGSIELVLLVLPLIGLSWKVAQSTDVEPGLYNPVETFNHQIEIERFNPIDKTLRVSILNILLAEFEKLKNTLTDKTKCGLLGNWRRIAYFDTTKGEPCPSSLRTVSNTTTNQTACGRNVSIGCTSLVFTTDGNYTNVCGRTRGYQYRTPDAFGHVLDNDTIDSAYLDGISITYGSPRTHLWSYIAGYQEDFSVFLAVCPCSRANPTDNTNVPNYVQEKYYCETGFVDALHKKIAWEDPLWDGSGCILPGNKCCDRYGWFHREVPATYDDIEVRWCADEDQGNEDVFTDQLEIWVM